MAIAPASFQATVELPHGEFPALRVATAPLERTTETTDATVASLAPFEAEWRRHELRVVLDVETDRGLVEFEMPLRVVPVAGSDEGWWLHGTAYRLTLDVELRVDRATIRWRLEPGGRDAAGRARVIDFLTAVSGRGVVVFRDPVFGDLAMAHLAAQPIDVALRDERIFLTDVLLIQAWSGVALPLPDEPDEASLRSIAEWADWIRRRRVNVRFASPITATTARRTERADELTLQEVPRHSLFGVQVPLGRWHYRVPVRLVGSQPNEDGTWTEVFEPSGDWTQARLQPLSRKAAKETAAVNNGYVPRLPEPRDTAPRRRAHELAGELTETWSLDTPDDDELRDQLRRRWPT